MIPSYQVSRDAARALEEFSDEMRGALVATEVNNWAGALGFVRTTDALKTTFPIPIDAAGYKEFKGDIKFRHLYARSLSMKGRMWSDGVEALAAEIEAPDFIDWAGAPENMATEWLRLPNEMVADMLAAGSLAGPLLDFYRDPDSETASTRRLFATDHPFNVLKPSIGSWDNTLQCTTAQIKSGEIFDRINDRFRSIKKPNGKPMGIKFDGGNLLIPSTRETLFESVLKEDLLIRAVSNAGVPDASANVVSAVTTSNRYKGKSYTVADELEDQDHFYAIAAPKPGLHCWVVQKQGAPEEIRHDKDSHKYKETLRVGVAYVGHGNAAACLPHRIIRVQITA